MRIQVKVIEVGWERDLDDNRHPQIRIGRARWSAVMYDHPANGWEVVSLEIVRGSQRRRHVEAYDGETATTKLIELTRGEMTLDGLVAVEEDLYEVGRKGAARRWVGKTVWLQVEQPT